MLKGNVQNQCYFNKLKICDHFMSFFQLFCVNGEFSIPYYCNYRSFLFYMRYRRWTTSRISLRIRSIRRSGK
jgi:hypothetical protein